jgi:hypothetical protein
MLNSESTVKSEDLLDWEEKPTVGLTGIDDVRHCKIC